MSEVADITKEIAETARKNPATVIGSGIGGAVGGPAGAVVGAGVGAVVDNQARHLDPGPAIGRAARQTEKNIRRAFRK